MFEFLFQLVKSPLFWLALFAAAFIFASGNEGGGKALGAFKRLLSDLSVSLICAWRSLLLSIPVIGAVIRAWVNSWTDERVQKRMDRHFAKSKGDRMLRGTWADRLEEARTRYSKRKFPHLWIANTPKDLERSLISDGKLITGDNLSYAAESFINTQHQGLAFRSGLMSAILWFTLMFVVWHPTVYLSGVRANVESQNGALSAQVVGDDDRLGLALGKNFWDGESFNKALAAKRASSAAAAQSPQPFWEQIALSFLDPLRLLFPLALALLLGWSAFRGAIRSALGAVSAGLHDNTKELVRWKYRQEQRNVEYLSYCEQLKQATTFDASPYLINFGKATGAFRVRGRLDAPYANQAMSMDMNAMHMGMLVFGGTGQGKTRTVLLPVLEQILDIRAMERGRAMRLREARKLSPTLPQVVAKSAAGAEFSWPFGITPNFDAYEKIDYPLDISVYLTDGKAVLYKDLFDLAAKKNLLRDLLVIGPNPALGEYSVDLLDGVAPQLLSDMIKSVARQAGGEKGGDFWPDMAADTLRNCAVVARVFDLTPAGLRWIEQYGERPYSLVFIYKLARDDGALLRLCLDAIAQAQDDPKLFATIAPLYTPEFVDAALYLTKEWLPMVDATRQGIKANITNVMGPFATNQVLRASFASGGGERIKSVDEFWGKLVVTNISTLDYGTAGRIINIFLKTLFMTEAARRQKQTTDLLSQLNAHFFERYPQFCSTRKTLESIEKNEGLLSQKERVDLELWAQAVKAAHRRADEIFATSRILTEIAATDDSMTDLENKINALVKGNLLDADAKRIMQEASDREEAFRAAYPHLSHERNTPMSNRDFSPSQLNGDREALELYYKIEMLSGKLLREKMFFMADEYQTLITVDAKDAALSDSSFWNISRAMGICAILATQSYSAFKQAIGMEALDNFSQQIRSKIFLPVEDPAVFEFIKKLSGKTLRSYTFEKDAYESYDAMIMETGTEDPFLHGVSPVGILDNDPASKGALASAVEGAFKPSSQVSSNDVIKNLDQSKRLDERFITPLRRWGNYKTGAQTNIDSRIASTQQATWRKEDLDHKRMSEGNQEVDTFKDDDYSYFGRNHAFAYLHRAGKPRMDIMRMGEVKVD